MTRRGERLRAVGLAAVLLLSVIAVSGVAAAAPQAALDVTDDAGTVAQGQTFEVTYTVTNDGDEDAGAAGLQIQTPDGITAERITDESDGTAALDEGAVSYAGGIPQGESVTTTIVYSVAGDAPTGDRQLSATATVGDSTASSSTQVTVGSATPASVSFSDQDSLNGGSVLVDSAAPGDSGEVLAVWNTTGSGAPDMVLGQISLDRSVTNKVIPLSPAIEQQQTLVAAVHSGSPTANNILAADTARVTPVRADAVTDDPDEVGTFWQGQVVVLQGEFTAGEDYQLREVEGARDSREVGSLEREIRAVNDGQLILRTDRVDADTYVVEDDSTALSPGDSLPTNLGNYDGFALEVAEQELNAAVTQDRLRDTETATLRLNSNRAGYDIFVSVNQTTVASFADLGDFEDGLQIPVPDVDEETRVQFDITVTDTTARATATVTVRPGVERVTPADVSRIIARFNNGKASISEVIDLIVRLNQQRR